MKNAQDNIVLVYAQGMSPMIGQKVGRIIRKPFFFKIIDQQEKQISYKLLPITFVGDELFVEGTHIWHVVKSMQIQEAYLKAINPI